MTRRPSFATGSWLAVLLIALAFSLGSEPVQARTDGGNQSNYPARIARAQSPSPFGTLQDSLHRSTQYSSRAALASANGGDALRFDGTDDYVGVPDADSLDFGTGDYTIETWIQRRTTGTRHDVLNKKEETTGHLSDLGLFIDANNLATCWTSEKPGSDWLSSAVTSVTPIGTTWTHLACTRASGTLTVYINGVADASATPTTRDVSNLGPLRIGMNVSNVLPFAGQIDEVRLWSVALSAHEIRDTMYVELAGTESGLAAYWKLNESGTTATAADSQSGGTHSGTLMNFGTLVPSPWRTSGAFGGPRNALHLDGTNDYVTIPSSGALAAVGSGDLTIEAWVKPGGSNNSRLFGNRSDSSMGCVSSDHWYNLTVDVDSAELELCPAGSHGIAVFSGSISSATWHHVAAVRQSNQALIYLDGVLVAQATVSTGDASAATDTYLGKWSDRFYQGSVDQVRVWNVARTATQIRDSMAQTLAGNESGLVAYYRMDEGTAGGTNTGLTTLYDITANHYDGTLSGFALTGSTSNWVSSTAFNTWIGGEGTDWGTVRNWSANATPAATDNVGIVHYSGGNDPTIGATANANHLVIATGGTLTAGGSNTLNVGGNWIQDGTFAPNSSTVVLNGADSQAIIGAATFYNLTVANTYGTPDDTHDVDPNAAITVTNNLAVNDGQFQPNTGSLFKNAALASGGILKPDSGANLFVTGSWTNDGGTFSANDGTVTLKGTAQTIGGTAATSFNHLAINDGLIAYWKFDDASGESAADSSGYGHAATRQAGATWTTSTVAPTAYVNPSALSFDGGTTAYLTATGINVANSSFTTAFWAKHGRIDQLDFVLGQGDGGTGNVLHVGFRTNNRFTFAFYDADIDTDSAYTDLDWHYWVCSYDTATRLQTIYRDGTIAGQKTSAVNYIGTGTFFLGRIPYLANGFSGQVDDIRIYKRALSSSEVTALSQYSPPPGASNTVTLGRALDVNGNLGIYTDSALDASTGNHAITVAGNWNSQGGTFTPQGGTVTLDGASQALTGSTTFNNLTKNVSSATTLTLPMTNTQTVLGTLNLQGASGALLSLRSAIASTSWSIDPRGTRTLAYLDVQDSNNVNATVINAAGTGSVNSGRNTNWYFYAPTDIALSNATLAENQPIGTTVGTLSSTDLDSGDTFTYTLVSGDGSTDNASFAISGSTLQTAAVLDYETKSSYSVRVRSTDKAGATYEEALTITVTNVNDPPVLTGTAFALPTIAEDVSSDDNYGITVGPLLGTQATDPEGNEVGIAVIGRDSTNGTWQFYSSDWYNIDQSGTPTPANAKLLPPGATLRFLPATNFSGTATLTFRAWDQSTGTAYGVADASTYGGTTAFSSATADVTETVTAVNDAPTIQCTQGVPALTFDGANDYVDVADLPAGSISGDYTVEAWVTLSTFKKWARIVDYGNGQESDNFILSQYNVDGRLNMDTWQGNSNGGYAYTTAPSALPLNQWVHVAGVNNGSGYQTLYINGSPVASGTQTVLRSITRVNNYIGRSNWSQDDWWQGQMRQIRIWDVARTLQQIQDNMNRPLTGLETGLVAYYPMSEGSGTTLPDHSGHGYGGTLMDNTAWTTITSSTCARTVSEDVATPITNIVAGDVDSGSSNVVMTLSASHGTLTIQTGLGLTAGQVSGNGTGSLSITAPIAGIASTLADANGLKYQGTANYVGYDTLAVQIDDQGATGGSAGVAGQNIDLTVESVNDAPVLDDSGSMTLTAIDEDPATNTGTTVTEIIASAGGDRITDADADALEGIAVTAVENTIGTWQFSTDGGSNWTAFGTPSAGAARLLAADTNTRVRFVPNANWSGIIAAGLTFHAWDRTAGINGGTTDASTGGGSTAFSSATETAALSVNAVNDAPVLDSGGDMALNGIDEDASTNTGTTVTTIIATGGGDRITDPDTGAVEGIAVIAVDNTHGAWQFSTDGGSNWTAFGSPSATIARLLAADTNTRIRFVPNVNWNGTVNPGITFRAWDQTFGSNGGAADTSTNGGSTAFSSGTETAEIIVNAVNDAPVLDPSGNMTLTAIDEDPATNDGTTVTAIIASAGGNRITDSDADALEGIAVTAVDDTNGAWQFSTNGGSNWTVFGTPSASVARLLAADANTRVRFVPGANWNGTIDPGITCRAWDQTNGSNGGTADASTGGGSTAFSSATETAALTVNAVDDAPVNTVPGTQGTSVNTAVTFSTGKGNAISIDDLDAGANPVRATLTATNGTVTLNGTSGLTFSTGDGNLDATMTFTGTVSNINTALNGLVMTPALDYSGSASLQLTTNDQGYTGSGGPLSDTDTISIVMSKSDTTLVITGNPTTTVYGQGVTLTATVTSTPPGAGTPTGVVTFTISPGTSVTRTLTAGAATYTTSTLAVGTHAVSASYSGDAGFDTSTGSLTPDLTVGKAGTTTLIQTSVQESAYGQTVLLVATVSVSAPGAGTPTGTVTFTIDALTPVTRSLSDGSASYSIDTLTVGDHGVTVTYGGDANVTGSSQTGTQRVVQAAVDTAVTTSNATTVFGESVTLTATLTARSPGAGTPTGSVQFLADNVEFGSPLTLTSGRAVTTTTALAVGAHTITTAYLGDGNYSPGTGSLSGGQTVTKAETSIAVIASSAHVGLGASATFTATVAINSPGAGTLTGNIQFSDNGSPLGGTIALDGNHASLSTSTLGAGSHSVTATYANDSSFADSTSSSVSVQVDQATTAATVASSKASTTFGEPVTFTATVTSLQGTPGGSVTFKDGSTTIGTKTLNAGGVATYTTSSLTASASPHSITAVYAGAGNYAGSTSASLSHNVNVGATTTTLASSAAAFIYGQSLTFTATVTASYGVVPTGQVTFRDGVTALGTGALNGSGVATFVTNTLAAGTTAHAVTATYGGSADLGPSTSAPRNVLVSKAGTTVAIVSSSPQPSRAGQPVQVTVSLSVNPPGTGNPTGSIVVSSGTITCTVTLPATACSLGISPSGTRTLTATYSGDTNYGAGSPAQSTHVVTNAQYYLPLLTRNYAAGPDLVVASISATPGEIRVVIKNQGVKPVVDEFWVDAYISPGSAPTHVNQTWRMLGDNGAVWGVTASALPLAPNATLTLSTANSPYYWPSESHIPGLISEGLAVYVQVDSAAAGSSYGAVLENHEIANNPYNNIGVTTVRAGAAARAGASAARDPAPSANLPTRP